MNIRIHALVCIQYEADEHSGGFNGDMPTPSTDVNNIQLLFYCIAVVLNQLLRKLLVSTPMASSFITNSL